MRMWRIIVMTASLMCALPFSSCVVDSTDLEVTAPRTTLRVGETTQLSVKQKIPGGSVVDLTDSNTGTVYHTTSESMLIPEPDGRVTCIGTGDRDEESAVIGAGNGIHHGHIRFKLLASGPGATLKVYVDKTTLREGESTQLHVVRLLPDGSSEDITRFNNTYLTFAGNGSVDSSVVKVVTSVCDGLCELVSAADSIGSYNYRTVIIFVRNGDSVGWIEMKVVHRAE